MSIDVIKKRLFVTLDSVIDEYRIDQISTNARINELNNDKNLVYFEVSDLREASIVCSKYIDYFNLGSGNWCGGYIVDEKFNFVAKVSYNGRVWDGEYPNCKEIIC
jgi:hypothetical protein